MRALPAELAIASAKSVNLTCAVLGVLDKPMTSVEIADAVSLAHDISRKYLGEHTSRKLRVLAISGKVVHDSGDPKRWSRR